MDASKIPFNALIVGPTNSGKSRFVVDQLYSPFRDNFDYIVLICPTFRHNKTYHRLGENDPRMDVIVCKQRDVERWLKLVRWLSEGTNTLIILDDCAASKDVKGRTGELVNLAFSARHMGISVWALTQKLTELHLPSVRTWRRSSSFTPLRRGQRKPSSTITLASSPLMSTKAWFQS